VLDLKACPSSLARPARYLFGDTIKTAARSHAEAREGRLPSDLFLEAVVLEPHGLPLATAQNVLLSVRIRPVPVAPIDGWKTAAPRLVQQVMRDLEHRAPGLAGIVRGFGFVPPAPADALCLADLAAPWKNRILTPVRGLYLCGVAAEPVPCVSGRAGRIAAALVADDRQEAF